ncbi:hypothetical protein N0V84_010685 [Fusarium piperis]|uniref:DUF7924 domain-containing protein n=1 Tax=Fusarium piperis TaxID=1435070 RepID=A0A9W8TDE8_9HYPO|nr:hypothetical protein N0V84_010685 [Fusarium piperis]
MSAGPSSQTKSTKVKTKKTSAYDRGFELHLDENGVKPTYSSQKPDLAELEEALEVNRTSLAPSTFLDGDFEKFRERNSRAKDETDVRETVMPTIVGPDPPYFTARNTVFGNLDSLTDGTIVVPKPDIYDGAVPKELDRTIRNQLAGHIVPSTMVDKPMAPNFFVEVKGPDGASAVAARQARYDGAIGARGMHSLQNHGREEPQYDGRPYTYTSTYQDSTLKLYAHHLTAPTTEGGQPEYHMTQVKGFDMTNDRETFVKGATAFRNARDLAKGHRDTFIQEANARASHGHAAELDEEE